MDTTPWDYDVLVKILVVGNSGVGKSCLLLRYADGTFVDSHMTTIGVDFKLKTDVIKGKKTKIQIWDTAGQERFRTITSSYYRGAHGILLVYDVTNEQSFTDTQVWLKEIQRFAQQKVSIVLVGNKIDDSDKRVVTTERGQELASELGLQFIETSAKDSSNVIKAFETIISSVIEKQNYLVNNTDGTTVIDGPSNIIAETNDSQGGGCSC